MVITVSIAQFRQNISDYVARARAGSIIILKDQKKDEVIAQLIGRKGFNLASFKNTLRQTAGTFTAQSHPEWRTKKDVIAWVEKTRKAADRSF